MDVETIRLVSRSLSELTGLKRREGRVAPEGARRRCSTAGTRAIMDAEHAKGEAGASR